MRVEHELVGVGHFALPLHELADPGEAGFVLGGDVVAGLVLPVGGDALFGDAVHLLGADLDLELVAAGRDEGGVQGLVEVGAGHGDEVFDAAGDGTPDGVEQAKDGVTVLHGLTDDADGEQVVNLVEGQLLVGDLLLDGVEALDAPLDAAGDFVFAQLGFELLDDAFEEDFAFAAKGVDLGGELLVGEGVGIAEGEVFELAAELAHAEAVGERGEDLEGFAGDLLALGDRQMLEGAHVVEAVGELDDDDAHVGDHGEEHFADVLGLVVFAVGEFDFVELGDTFDDVGDLVAETLFDLFGGDVGVFDGVVEEAGSDGGGVHLELGEDQADFEGMDDVGLAGGALLAFVLLQGEGPGLADDFEVVAGAIVVDLLEEAGEFLVDLGDVGGAGAGEVAGGTLFGSGVGGWWRRVGGFWRGGGWSRRIGAGGAAQRHSGAQLIERRSRGWN